ncbi:hypothetical protein [Aquimarina megaterium]|uniref:hypothetical protein n=1 Tax=Aquimarina megaterium TaxID=1443666 RepID=UPI0009436264|nr:hypothetical protein [Aquimarina megaterium]
MKTLTKIYLICSTTLLLFSCTNDHIEESVQGNSIEYFLNGRSISIDEIDKSQDLIYLHSKPNVVYVFDSNQKYEEHLLKLSNTFPEGNEQKQSFIKMIKANQIASKIAMLAEKNDIEKNDELSNKITSLLEDLKKVKNNESKAVGFVKLFEDTNLQGRSGTFPNIVFKLRKSWRNKASSFSAIGGGTLVFCDKTRFRGSKRVFLFAPYIQNPDLGVLGFDNRLESFF